MRHLSKPRRTAWAGANGLRASWKRAVSQSLAARRRSRRTFWLCGRCTCHASKRGGVSMDFELSDDQRLLKENARNVLAAEWPTSKVRQLMEMEQATGVDARLWQQMAELG